jgi:MinD superfamily P-loop ATPase
MKTVSFVSGKGGTGKTSLAAAFARLAAPVVVADCDVDAANLALLLPGEVEQQEPFIGGVRAEIDPEACTACGLCAEACRFDAVKEAGPAFQVLSLACEGCGVCHQVCAFDAVRLRDNLAGTVQVLRSGVGPLVRGELRAAQSNSGKLVARVRELAREVGERQDLDLLLLDGPPGIGCPVHATLTGVDLAVAVTEPTPSGEHDLERIVELLHHFEIPGLVIINKADLAPTRSAALATRVASWGLEVVGELPFAEAVPRELAHGKTPLEVPELRPWVERIWQAIRAPLTGASDTTDAKDATGTTGEPAAGTVAR